MIRILNFYYRKLSKSLCIEMCADSTDNESSAATFDT